MIKRGADDTTSRAPLDALARVGPGFMAGYALAQVGAFIAFIPLLSLLLPLKAEAIDPGGKALLLSQVALWGAMAAGVSNLAFGVLSDATWGRWGRRRPWIIGGTLGLIVTYGLIYLAPDPTSLLIAVVLFQVTLNAMFGSLNALLPERVPDRQKGLMSALAGLGHPAAALFGAVVVAILLSTTGARFLAVVACFVLLVLPFAIRLKERPTARRPVIFRSISLKALADPDFLMAFLSRLFVQVTITLNVLYLLYYLQEATDVGTRFAGTRPEAVLGWLTVAATVTSIVIGFFGGLLSDRLLMRRHFVVVGALSMSAGALTMALAPQWPGPLVAQLLFGAGLGLYSTVDLALVAQVLPDPDQVGRDLGIMNIAITVPQVAAPMIGLGMMAVSNQRFEPLFMVSAVFAAMGALVVLFIRRVA